MLGAFESTGNKKCVPVLKCVPEDEGVWGSGVIFIIPFIFNVAVDGSEHAPAAFFFFIVGKSHHCSLIRCWIWASGPVEM